MIIIGGYQMVTSAGNEEGYKKAKQTITYAVIGLVIAVLSYSIASIVENTLGANLAAPATSSVSSSSSTSGTPSPAAGTPAATSTNSNGTPSTSSNSTNGTTSNNSTTQAAPIPASSSSCTAAAMGGINISAPSSAVIDPNNGGSINYAITPDNSSAQGCQVTVNTYILEGSDTWDSSLQANSTSTSFGTTNTLNISQQYSQDPYVTIYSRYTDSTGKVLETSENLKLSETCSAAAVGGINLSVPSSVTVDPSTDNNPLEYTIKPDNSSAAGCNQVTIDTYILVNGASGPASGQQPDDTSTGFGNSNTVNIPGSDASGSEITLYSVYTDSTGQSVNTSESVNITQPTDNNSDSNGNDGSYND
jgi:hypothetical protein